MNPQELNPEALDITKAIAYTENGGKPDISNTKAGKTGELKSIFQYEPGTWKNDAKQVLGNADAPLTPENESLVTYSKVNKWLGQGYTAPQIASMWNAGVGEPDAYTGKFSDGSSSKGVNKKYGVKYDVPGYVNKFNKYLADSSSTSTSDNNEVAESTPETSPAPPKVSSAPTQSTPTKSKGMINADSLPQLAVNQGLIKNSSLLS